MIDQPPPKFPREFLWGASSSAFQVEGGLTEGGRGPSVWDGFGPITNDDTAAVATDHYHRHATDVALMRDAGIGAYRFSIAWPRIFPRPGSAGSGRPNEDGLDFYDRLVDELRAAGIQPAPTLFHWDTPQSLEDDGGWLNRDTAHRFADYAAAVVARLGDRVDTWITVNEPAEHTLLGYGLGHHAPGRRLMFDALPAAHHLLLAHGLAVQALRAGGARNIGLANSHGPVWRADDGPGADFYDMLTNWLFADPILLGRYPDDDIAALMPGPVEEDLKVIGTPVDWYGVNYYQPMLVGDPTGADASFGGALLPAELPFAVHRVEGYPRTDFDWPDVPGGLQEILTGLRARYGTNLPPIYITENGCSYADEPDDAGRVADARRIAFLDGHIRAVHTAIDDGIDVRAYFVWSLTDNFEWAAGYAQRFGLVYIDYDTLQRIPKDSFYWYRDLIRAGA